MLKIKINKKEYIHADDYCELNNINGNALRQRYFQKSKNVPKSIKLSGGRWIEYNKKDINNVDII